MKRKNIVIIAIISITFITLVFTVVATMLGVFSLFTRVLVRDNHGSQFEQTWKCSEYGISFKSDNLRFPYQPDTYIGYVKYKNIDTIVEVSVDGYSLCFGNYDGKFSTNNLKPDTDPEAFVVYASGDLEYASNSLKVKINKTNDEFNFLMHKKLEFKKFN